MLTYDLKVGYACNNKCKHCVIADSKEKLLRNRVSSDLTTEECINQIDAELKNGIDRIVLTGGEVTIRKDFNILIEKCHENNLGITIQTNGRKLNDEKVINAVENIHNIKFIVALHGSIPKTHDDITQVIGSYNETCNGIKAMTEINKLVVLKVVISKINAEELPAIVTKASELGVKFICFAFPHGQGAARENFDEIVPKYSELKPILEDTINISKKLGIQIEFEAIPFCIIPNHMKMVGELKYFKGDAICTQVNESTFNWNEVRQSIKRKGKNCNKCIFDSICEGPWMEYTEFFGDNELIPIIVNEVLKDKILNTLNVFRNKK